MADGRENDHAVELYRERLPDLVEYLKGDQVRRAVESGRPIINITINEAPRPAPVAPPPDPLAKYTPYMILYLGFTIIAGIFAVILVMIVPMIETLLIATAVCSVAVAAAVRSLRITRTEAKVMERGRTRARRR
jgi:hypothetical protein